MASYDYLEQILKRNLGGNNPLFAQLFGSAQQRIGRTTDRNVRQIKQQGAQSGFRGVNANNINEAYRSESDTLGKVQGDIGQMEWQDQQKAIEGLLGIENMKSQETGWGDVLGGMLGMGVGAFTGGMGGAVGAGLTKDWF